MKKSHRYFRGTFVTLAVSAVVMVGANRVYTPAASAYVPQRVPAADLESLRSFTAVRADGDFALEVQEQSAFAVSYEPANEKYGEFRAHLEGSTLVLGGYGNRIRGNSEMSVVRVGLPVLQRLSVNGSPLLVVSNFSKESTEVRINNTRTVQLLHNSAPMNVNTSAVNELQLDNSSIENATLHILGYTTVKHLSQ